MHRGDWLWGTSPAFRLMIATSWLAPDSWKKNQEEAIREAVETGPDWNEYVRLVDRHRTPALSWATLSRVPGIVVPLAARRKLEKNSDACRMQAVRHCLLLAEVLKVFNHFEIPIMSFKGQILSFELYGDVGLRQSRDLDLAVTQEKLPMAQGCLLNLGWRLKSTWFALSPRQWSSFLRHEHHLEFVHSRTGGILELHWRNQWDTPEQTRARWTRSVPFVWQGCTCETMNPIDIALYLCDHGGEHLWFRAKWLGDLACLHAAGRVDWEAALCESRRTGQERVLLLGLRMLEHVYGLPLPSFAGNPWTELPSLLIQKPLQALKDPGEPGPLDTSPTSFYNRLQMSHYEKLLRPGKTWQSSVSQFLYSREDFRNIHLPDGLFWAYLILRPFQWVWRWTRRSGGESSQTPEYRK